MRTQIPGRPLAPLCLAHLHLPSPLLNRQISEVQKPLHHCPAIGNTEGEELMVGGVIGKSYNLMVGGVIGKSYKLMVGGRKS